MPRPTRLTIAKKDILAVFEDAPQKVYSQADIAQALAQHRTFWRLAERTRVGDFITFLERQGRLKSHEFRATNYARTITRYAWGEVSPYELALSFQPRGYLSHSTAVALHGLTDLIPKALFLNVEQSPKPLSNKGLTQRGIDLAFSRKQRQSNLTYSYDGYSVTIVSGKNTGGLGVEEIFGPRDERLKVTNLERTLIDIVVRPAYSGGVFQALEVYRAAKDKLSVNRLLALLKKLNYIYPYHQAIGFLMERAGFDEKRLKMLMALPMDYNFYLTHGMKESDFSAKWRLFYPKGF
jgi:predicted transcriptional regulator of viral defense system